MMPGLHLIALIGFVALMAAAAIEDLRRLIIPNRLVLALCALWPVHLATAADTTLAAGLGAVGCAAGVFLAGTLLFARGLIGGGDVKLLSAAALWAGAGAVAPLFVLTGLIGGFLALLLLTPLGAWIGGHRRIAAAGAAGRAAGHADGEVDIAAAGPIAVPYGVAIAGAALIVTIPQHFG